MKKMIDKYAIISRMNESERQIARELGMSRKTVRKYLTEYREARSKGQEEELNYLKAEPKYRCPARPKPVMTDGLAKAIDEFLQSNKRKIECGDRKLCLKNIDIHHLLVEQGYDVSYATLCNYVAGKKVLPTADCYIRQSYLPGEECEFDWGEVYLTISGTRMKFYLAVFTMCYSNYRCAYLFRRQDSLAFMESHVRFFRHVNGVPKQMTYDNMRVAVASFDDGKTPTADLIRMESHYGFTHRFCNARSGNEKGHVERSVEFVRRKAFAVKSDFRTIEEAQRWLADTCDSLNGTGHSKATTDIVERSRTDLSSLLPFKDDLGVFSMETRRVDKYGTITFGGDRYSVPDSLVGTEVRVIICSNTLEIYDAGGKVAVQERTPVNGWKLDIMHYLDTFVRKPGALHASEALKQSGEGLQRMYGSIYADRPEDFVCLLQKAKERGMTVRDILAAYELVSAENAVPKTPESLDDMLFGDKAPETISVNISGTSSKDEIESYAVGNLVALTNLMDKQNNTYHAN